MIVMKFGGSSLSSPPAFEQVASIVKASLDRRPVVVASAIGDTTDLLLAIYERARRANSYLCWKQQEELKDLHFCLAEDLLSGEELGEMDAFIRQTFRDLHVRLLELCEGERTDTPELRDSVAGLGEQLSSRLLTAALHARGVRSCHLDAQQLIVTNENFGHAAPRYWETYARIRRQIPKAAQAGETVVLGGFIGATADGRPTTLGRGGSDLTASIVGAALNADEIRVWKDVDGMLTWDPRLQGGGYRVKRLSYREAEELAGAGANILHPETILPARRLRIPVVIANTFCPAAEGTRIDQTSSFSVNPVKSIACQQNITLLELRSSRVSDRSDASAVLSELQHANLARTQLLALSGDTLYLAVEGRINETQTVPSVDRCVEVHIQPNQAVMTLVGQGLAEAHARGRIASFLEGQPVSILPFMQGSCSLRIVVPQDRLRSYLRLLAQHLFKDVDARFFAPVPAQPAPARRSVAAVAPSTGSRLAVRSSRPHDAKDPLFHFVQRQPSRIH